MKSNRFHKNLYFCSKILAVGLDLHPGPMHLPGWPLGVHTPPCTPSGSTTARVVLTTARVVMTTIRVLMTTTRVVMTCRRGDVSRVVMVTCHVLLWWRVTCCRDDVSRVVILTCHVLWWWRMGNPWGEETGIFGDGDFGIFFRIPKNPQNSQKIPKKTIFRNNFKTVVLIYF